MALAPTIASLLWISSCAKIPSLDVIRENPPGSWQDVLLYEGLGAVSHSTPTRYTAMRCPPLVTVQVGPNRLSRIETSPAPFLLINFALLILNLIQLDGASVPDPDLRASLFFNCSELPLKGTTCMYTSNTQTKYKCTSGKFRPNQYK